MSFGFALGAVLGLTPVDSLLNVVTLILIYFLNVNISVAVVAALIYKLIGMVLSRYSHLIGYYLLANVHGLYGMWTYLYNLPVVPWTRFYNTVVLGSFVLSLILFISSLYVASV